MNWTDYLMFIIIGGNMLYGFNRGFITTFIGLIKWFASIILAKMFYVEFTQYVIQNWYDPAPVIHEHVERFVTNMLNMNTPADVTMTAEQIKQGIESLNLPEFYSKGLAEFQGNITFTRFTNDIASQITQMIIYVMGFLLLLLIIMSLLGILEAIANQLARLPVIKEFNKSGGLILGAILGLISVYFIMIILNVFITFEWSQNIVLVIENSKFAVYFYKYNILQYFFVSFLSSLYKSFLMI
ncbi:CvpA family protein [Fusibacter ferrireducens]|uniref:CvpA family protein n=1 Tax=Fusibacter ferrireducens TaxID=2785058 RepID=A0ABR9ZYC7_9FIRM|nr:CvpA family protein [Fusibacter ferrireducens]MBF4695473.1 CvpA family protein [Fusibacter ferrireducens]